MNNPYSDLFAQTEAEQQLPPGLLTEVAKQESNYNPEAVGPQTKYGTAKGLFQFIDPTAKEYGITDPFDPVQSTKAAGKYLGSLYKKYNGDLVKTLAAYNWGPGNVDRHGIEQAPHQTQKYIYNIASKLGNAIVGSAQADTLHPDDEVAIFGSQADTNPSIAPEDEAAIFGPAAQDEIFGKDSRKPYQIQGTPEFERAKNENIVNANFLDPNRPASPFLSADETRTDRFGMPMLATAAHMGQYAARALRQANPPEPIKNYLQQAQGNLDTISSNLSTDQQSLAPQGVDWARLGGEVTTTAPLGMGRALPKAAASAFPKAAALANNAAAGGLTGALLTDPNTQDAGQGAATGAIASSALPPVLSGLGKAVSGTLRPAAQYLKDAGVTLTPGQMLGPMATRIEQAATSIPFLGDLIKNRQVDAAKSFNKAVTNHVLDPIGTQLPKDVEAGHAAVGYAADAIGAQYDKYVPQAVAVADPAFTSDISKIALAAKKLPADQQKQIQAIWQSEFVGKAQGNQLTGQTLKDVDSELGRLGAQYKGSPSPNDRELGNAIFGMQQALRASMTRNSAPDVSEGISAANSAWARFLRLQAAAVKSKDTQGAFSPESFTSSVRKFDASRNKGKFARGDALMQNLADAGVDVLGRRIPDSGTATRSMLGLAGVGGLGYLHPNALIGAGMAAIPYTKAGNWLIQQALTARPAGAAQLGQGISAVAPYLGSAGAPVGNALLNYGH